MTPEQLEQVVAALDAADIRMHQAVADIRMHQAVAEFHGKLVELERERRVAIVAGAVSGRR